MTQSLSLFLILGGLLALGIGSAPAGEPAPGFLDCIYKDDKGTEARYVLFVPHYYTDAQSYPLILFLHGMGETGTDGRRQVAVGLGPAIRKQAKTFPFLAVFPQSHKRNWRADSADGRRAMAILAEVQGKYKVDPKRIYLTGLSMGGFGTWSLAVKYPDRWAAIVPICGGGNPKQAGQIKDIPCWCFHGGADPVVPARLSRDMIQALEKAGGHPKYTEYPEVGHNSWDQAYGTEKLYSWLLKQQRK